MSSLDNIERIFLLEILVDNVYLAQSELDLNPRILSALKQTCVTFQFLNYPALEICEEDFAPSKGKYDENEVSFKTGKSCLFALRGTRPAAFSPPFNMDVTVCKMFANNKSCAIGKTCIKLGECFATIINCCIVCPTSPTTKTIKETYPLMDDRDCEIGSITIFIRLSCFGKFIITQFQLGGLENKSFLFRAESETIKPPEEQKTITPTKYKTATETGGNQISKPETFCETVSASEADGGPISRETPGFSTTYGGMSQPCMPTPFMGGGMSMPTMMQSTGMGMPNMMPMPGMGMANMMPSTGMGGMMPMSGFGAMMPNMGQQMQLLPITDLETPMKEPPSMKIAPDSDYKELTASVNGHELSIQILRRRKQKKETKSLPDIDSDISVSENKDGDNVKCKCNPTNVDNVDCKCKSSKTNVDKPRKKIIPCPLAKKVVKSDNKVNVKENFLLRLGNRPRVCYKLPEIPPPPPLPCVTERESQFKQEDMERAKKLHEEYLKQRSRAASVAGSSKKGKDKGKKGKKDKDKKKKGKKK